MLRSLFTIAGGEKTDWAAVPCLGTKDVPKHSESGATAPVIYLVRDDAETKVRLVMEPKKKK